MANGPHVHVAPRVYATTHQLPYAPPSPTAQLMLGTRAWGGIGPQMVHLSGRVWSCCPSPAPVALVVSGREPRLCLPAPTWFGGLRSEASCTCVVPRASVFLAQPPQSQHPPEASPPRRDWRVYYWLVWWHLLPYVCCCGRSVQPQLLVARSKGGGGWRRWLKPEPSELCCACACVCVCPSARLSGCLSLSVCGPCVAQCVCSVAAKAVAPA